MKCSSFGEQIERHCQACGHCVNDEGHEGDHEDRCGHRWETCFMATVPPEQICNRQACRAPDALWWNPSTRAYYCQPCALKINDANPGLCFKLTPRSERPVER